MKVSRVGPSASHTSPQLTLKVSLHCFPTQHRQAGYSIGLTDRSNTICHQYWRRCLSLRPRQECLEGVCSSALSRAYCCCTVLHLCCAVLFCAVLASCGSGSASFLCLRVSCEEMQVKPHCRPISAAKSPRWRAGRVLSISLILERSSTGSNILVNSNGTESRLHDDVADVQAKLKYGSTPLL